MTAGSGHESPQPETPTAYTPGTDQHP